MKLKTFLFALFSLSMTFTYAQFGAKIGSNISGTGSYGNSEEGESVELKIGYQAGVFYNYALTEKVNLLLELNYEARGTISKKDYNIMYPVRNPENGEILGIGEYTVSQEANSRQNYLNLPILVVLGGEKFKYYVGPNIGVMINGKADFDRTIDITLDGNPLPSAPEVHLTDVDWFDYDSFKAIFSPTNVPEENDSYVNRLDIGINIGAMYYVMPELFIDLRVNQGFLDVTNNHYDNSIYPNADYSFSSRDNVDRNISIQLGLGYSF